VTRRATSVDIDRTNKVFITA